MKYLWTVCSSSSCKPMLLINASFNCIIVELVQLRSRTAGKQCRGNKKSGINNVILFRAGNNSQDNPSTHYVPLQLVNDGEPLYMLVTRLRWVPLGQPLPRRIQFTSLQRPNWSLDISSFAQCDVHFTNWFGTSTAIAAIMAVRHVFLTHPLLVWHICVNELGQHWFR